MMDKSLDDNDESVSDRDGSGDTSVPAAVEMVATNCLREPNKLCNPHAGEMLAKSNTTGRKILLAILLPPVDHPAIYSISLFSQ
mmetsp:Transcript_2339/g.4937  ORF Transcript_2339/g.4937 Transcript_2339/m.4937 type:complete len:84 (-) Transcript_2339:62-313(-)